MARKKKSKAQSLVIKYILISMVAIGIGLLVGRGAIHLFRHSDYFKVQSIVIDPSLQFINKRDLKNIIGKNIFEIDLLAVQQKLSYKYPQAAHLKIIKKFPNQLAIIAKKRIAFAQVQSNQAVIVLDKESVVLSVEEITIKNLPVITGLEVNAQRLVRGLPLRGTKVRIALEIVEFFEANQGLSSYSIEEVNMTSLSKINFVLSNHLEIVIDQDNIAQKIRILEVVLSQGKLDLKEVKYVDLRFKEPIIGKK